MHAMNGATRSARHIGPRIACAVGLVLVVIGSLLLGIVGDPPRARIAFVAGIAMTGFGAISIAAACEALWFSTPAKFRGETAFAEWAWLSYCL